MKWAPSAEQIRTLAGGYNRIVETSRERCSEALPEERVRLNEVIQATMAKVLAETLLEQGCPQEELVEWIKVVVKKAADERERDKQLLN